jgi:hypothetical protein
MDPADNGCCQTTIGKLVLVAVATDKLIRATDRFGDRIRSFGKARCQRVARRQLSITYRMAGSYLVIRTGGIDYMIIPTDTICLPEHCPDRTEPCLARQTPDVFNRRMRSVHAYDWHSVCHPYNDYPYNGFFSWSMGKEQSVLFPGL